jgi:hypothetical protein
MAAPRTTRRGAHLYLALGAAITLLSILSACSAGAPAGASATPSAATSETPGHISSAVSKTAATQTSEGGQVTVAVSWPGVAAGPVFSVALDTHSVDLDGIDLTQTALLRIGQGEEIQPSAWDAPKGGHHRSGTLTFPSTTADGSPVLSASTSSLELVIRDVGGVGARSFRWTP